MQFQITPPDNDTRSAGVEGGKTGIFFATCPAHPFVVMQTPSIGSG
jgi:hypothetical protein